jgi:bacterial peptide chain release factor 2 (bRF-2)
LTRVLKNYTIRAQTAETTFWNDNVAAQKVLKELSEHKSWTESFVRLESALKAEAESIEVPPPSKKKVTSHKPNSILPSSNRTFVLWN